jgi:hypothetical protein
MNIQPPLKYEIRRKNIPKIKIFSVNGAFWYDFFGNLIPWSNGDYLGPNEGFIVFNNSGLSPDDVIWTGKTISINPSGDTGCNLSIELYDYLERPLSSGYYVWTGTTINSTISGGDDNCDLSIDLPFWKYIEKSEAFDDFQIPLYLESTVDEMGVMVGFDGELEQIEQICNFSYTQTGNTIQVYNTVDTSKVSEIHNVDFIVDWGDGTNDILSTTGITTSKTYPTTGEKTISISINTPWTQFETKKTIKVPSDTTIINPMGTLSGFTIPYTNITGQTLDYLNDLEYNGVNTGYTTFNYASIGKSRISEKKLYGNNTYTGVTIGTLNGVSYSGYTIDGLYYQDFEDGITTITGTTSGFTKEEVVNRLLTRNEHFIGFIDEPVIYSDIFIERGKQGVLEKTLRLSEIDNTGELGVYGNGYFNIRKQ